MAPPVRNLRELLLENHNFARRFPFLIGFSSPKKRCGRAFCSFNSQKVSEPVFTVISKRLARRRAASSILAQSNTFRLSVCDFAI